MAKGICDTWRKKRKLAAPKIDQSLVGYKIVTIFAGVDDNGQPFDNWYHAVVVMLMNDKNKTLRIDWNNNYLGDYNVQSAVKRLGINKWNPGQI